MTSNITEFTAGLDRFERLIDERRRLVVQKVALQALEGVVFMSPVDKGRFRGNWQVSINVKFDTAIEAIDQTGGATVAKGAEVIARVEGDEVIWLTNALPYAVRLEAGYSKQAPVGMVSVTAERLRAQFT